VTDVPAAALAAAAAARVIVVIGGNDTGKTTLVTRLASELARRGSTVGVVDADLGQSDVGPPTTVGLGRVRAPIERLAQAEVVALHFIGVTSPARCVHETAEATARLAAHALRNGCDRLVVDTCGLVDGDVGRSLKRSKIERVAPDLVIALQREDECETILGDCAATGRPRIVRLPAAPTTPRSMNARRRHRERLLARHLAGATPRVFSLAQFDLRTAPATRGLAVVDLGDVLVGLDGRDGWTLGLGRISAVDVAAGRLTIDTTFDPARVKALVIGRERFSGHESAGRAIEGGEREGLA
jgi:polynucleotide 5'-kinase involved in rRNA processing